MCFCLSFVFVFFSCFCSQIRFSFTVLAELVRKSLDFMGVHEAMITMHVCTLCDQLYLMFFQALWGFLFRFSGLGFNLLSCV